MAHKKELPKADDRGLDTVQFKAYEKVTAMRKMINDKDRAIEGAALEWYKDARNASVRGARAVRKVKELAEKIPYKDDQGELFKYDAEIREQLKNVYGEFAMVDNIYLVFCQKNAPELTDIKLKLMMAMEAMEKSQNV